MKNVRVEVVKNWFLDDFSGIGAEGLCRLEG